MFIAVRWMQTHAHQHPISITPTLTIHTACDECGHMPGFELWFPLWFGSFVLSCFFGDTDPLFLRDLGLLEETTDDRHDN